MGALAQRGQSGGQRTGPGPCDLTPTRPLAAERRPREAKAHRAPRPGALDASLAEIRRLGVVRKGASPQSAESLCREDVVFPPRAQGQRPAEVPSAHGADGVWEPASAAAALGGLWP